MIDANKAKELVEDETLLTDGFMKTIEDRTLAAIADGRRETSMRFSAKDSSRKALWPLKNRLKELGYEVLTRDTIDGTVLRWDW